MPDVFAVVIWWLLLQAMGLVALPLVFRLLRWLPDRGYSIAKPAGLLLGNYVLWLLGTLGWLRNGAGGALIAFGLVAVFGWWVYRRWDDGPRLIDWLRSHLNWIVAYELVFAIALAFWALYRANNPDLFTTEKPMEFAFMNAIGRSATFPPPDPWLSGFTISYYYFGYVIMAALANLSGVASGAAFSLTNAMWFALTAAGAFGIVANLVAASKAATQRAIVGAGLLGALFVPILSNFEGPLEVAYANAVGPAEFWRWLDIREINTPPRPLQPGETRWPFCDGCGHPRGVWWFWRASRVVHDYPIGSDRSNPDDYEELIDEFPFFSFFLGDNHPHVLALPYALMSMGLAFNLFRKEGSATAPSIPLLRQFWDDAPIALMYPILLGGLSFLNLWDFPIHVFIVAVAWGLGRWLTGRHRAVDVATDGFLALVACGLLGVVAYLPFYIGFRSQAGGILPNIFWPTRLPQFFVMFGPFLMIGTVFLIALIARAIRARRTSALRASLGSLLGGAGIAIGAGLATALVAFLVLNASGGARAKLDEWTRSAEVSGLNLTQAAVERLGEFGVPLVMGIGMAATVIVVRSRRSDAPAESAPPGEPASFVTMLFFVGALLAFAVEYVYLLDFFGTRMNTVFKLYYQTWALWGVASAYAVYHLLHSSERLIGRAGRAVFVVVLAVAVVGGLVYPLLAIPGGTRLGYNGPPTLDAREPTRQASADVVAAIDWLARNAAPDAVVLETVGSSYHAETSRLSAWTGIPTVLGWEYHEGQWRGTYADILPRKAVVEQIYQTTDPLLAMDLLKKYGVTYVYVGPDELGKYPPESLAKFKLIMDTAFQQGQSTIYRRRDVVASDSVGSN